MDARSEVDRNCPWCDGFDESSFLSRLHEDWEWIDDEYWKLDRAMRQLAIEYDGAESLPRELTWRIMRIFSYGMLVIGCHYDKDDHFKIKNLTTDQLHECRERFQLTFEGFFKGRMTDNNLFEYSDPSPSS